MIPRLQRQRGRVRGGTILPGRQNRDPVGPPTSPTPSRSEPSPSTKRTSASESRSARGCAGAVTPLRVRRSGRCVSWCEAHTSARDVPGTGGHWTSDSSESCTTSSAPGHPGPGTGAAARSPGNPRERTPGRRSRGSSVDLAERAAFSPRRAFRTRERRSNRHSRVQNAHLGVEGSPVRRAVVSRPSVGGQSGDRCYSTGVFSRSQ